MNSVPKYDRTVNIPFIHVRVLFICFIGDDIPLHRIGHVNGVNCEVNKISIAVRPSAIMTNI